MAQTSWPFENIDTSEAQFSAWARSIGEGIRQSFGGELEVSADGSGMSVSVLSGQALVRGHYYDSSSTESVTIPTADATNPRIDTVVLKLDPTANTITLFVVEGTPGASPSAPSLTQTESLNYEYPLADIAVAAGAVAISSGNVTDRRTFLVPVTQKQDIITGAATTITSANLDVDRALISNASGKVAVSPVTGTELGYLDGVTSAVQTQLNGKVDEVNGAVTTASTGSTVVRNITLSTGDPTGGVNGQIWLKYEV